MYQYMHFLSFLSWDWELRASEAPFHFQNNYYIHGVGGQNHLFSLRSKAKVVGSLKESIKKNNNPFLRESRSINYK